VIDGVDDYQSPAWWIKRLSSELLRRNQSPQWRTTSLTREARPPLDLLSDYLRGDPPLPKVAEGWQAGFRQYMRMARMNYAELVVEPTRERMIPIGFRTAASDDENGDSEAARVMAVQDLELKLTDAFDSMLGLGDGYAIVGLPDEESGVPLITAEDPRQVITAHDPATGRGLAGLKLFRDEWDAKDWAFLYLAGERGEPVQLWVASRGGISGLSASSRFMPKTWEWDPDRHGAVLPFDRLNVVRFQNRRGVGEFEPHLDVLDRINDTLLDRVVISKIQAYRQRAIRGLPETSDGAEPTEDGSNVIDYTDVFSADPGSMWQVPEGVEFWESSPVDLGPVRLAIQDDVKALAAVTRTPLHLITPDAANGSAEGAALMREGHLAKVKDRRRRAGSGLAELMSLAFSAMDDEQRADRSGIVTIWEPAEQFSLTERMSAATQAKAAGLPQDAVFTDVMQYRPEDVDRLNGMRAKDLLYALTQAPAVDSSTPLASNPVVDPGVDPSAELAPVDQ
jgi:hypothetical protein